MKIKEIEDKDKYLDLAREQKKLGNMKVLMIPIGSWNIWYSSQLPGKLTGGIGDQKNN